MIKKAVWVLGLIAILIAGAIGGDIGKQVGKEIGQAAFAPSKLSAMQTEEALIEVFTKVAEQANKRGPIMVDEDTRWERCEVGPGTRLTYFYSFPNFTSRDIEATWIKEDLKLEVMKAVCASNEMKPPLQKGAAYAYVYSGKDGVEITRFEINKNDCNWASSAHADIFGPSNYDECIQQNMKGVQSDVEARHIARSCRSQFPLVSRLEETYPWLTEEIAKSRAAGYSDDEIEQYILSRPDLLKDEKSNR